MALWSVLWAAWLWPLLISAQDYGWGGGGDDRSGSNCPRWEDNPWCTCLNTQGGVSLECPMVSLETVSSVLGLINSPVTLLRMYDLESNITVLPPEIFDSSSGVANLQVTHSNIQSLAEGSLKGLEESLKSLSIQHCKLSTIPQDALHNLQSLQQLNLEANNITELPSFGFSKVSLNSLNLKGNMIKLVSDYAFDGLDESLSELNLMNNDLKNLPVISLKKLRNLTKIMVAWNHITEIDFPSNFSLPSLYHFDFSNNEIRKIKSKCFSGMPDLVSLSLYMNKISSVSKNGFRENSALETLFLGHNDIRELDSETFAHNPKIRILDLGSNNIQTIHGGLFHNLPELEELDLSRNNIREVTQHTFKNSSKVKILNLEHNAIRFLELETFLNMTDLDSLLLSHNNIQEIYPELFSSNLHLRILKLDHNRITNLDDITFRNTTKLQKLFLQNNNLMRIKREYFANLVHLQELHLQENMIQVIDTGAFSSLERLESLNLQDNEIATLPDTLSHSSVTLRYLYLSGNYITSLHHQALTGQRNLDALWLDRNNISHITNGVFGDLSFVRQLHLEHNQIREIQDNAFGNMTDLRKLFLSYNFLESVGQHTFQGLSSIKELYLDHNSMKEIYPNAFQSMKALEILDMSSNELSSIKRDLFQSELPIWQLDIDNAHIREIEEGSFEALINLETLSLRGNNLRRLQQDFLKLTQLRNLYVSGNSFLSLDANSLTGLPNLETLELNNCDIDNIPDNFFDSSMSLWFLSIAGNKLTYLKPAAFVGLNDLTKLDLSSNSLGLNSCRAVLTTTKLEYLSISDNPTRDLCPGLGELKRLRELHASNIHMTEVQPAIMEELRRLEVLDVSGNLVTEFPIGSFLGSSLKRLNLANNQLQQLPNAIFFDRMMQLSSLNVSGNPLRQLTGSQVRRDMTLPRLEQLEATHTNLTVLTSLELTHMPALRSLNLQHAAINKVSPGAFKSLTQLSHLNLAHNMLEILPRERLRGLVMLTQLNLTRNRLNKLDQLPPDSKNLKVLDASGNMLMELEEATLRHTEGLEELILKDNWITVIHPRAFHHLPYLSVLDMSYNNLEELRPAVFEPIERKLQKLFIHNNPVSCGCNTVELWTWLLNHPGQVQQPRDLTCDLPEPLHGQSFLLLSSSSFCPQPVILRLAIQDIQSQSLLVSWQATNSSAVYGFKVTHRAVGGDETQSSPTLGLTSRTFQLKDLHSSTEYQVCVHGLTRSLAQPLHQPPPHARAHTVAAVYDREQEEEDGVRCGRGYTLRPPAAPATGTAGGKLGLILGATLAAALLLGFLVALIWYLRCRSRRRGGEKRANGVPPDYYSHYKVRPSNHHHQEDDDFAC
ncbi:hypothetical protein Pcinc_043303 [Petrolisthes cinctipes]|uniref:Fibronectin type-III domain-containing protein n=1 Tax=Petrolisthes cinctipes TaxID=88211 RepID=A0AAE1BFV5_PETCI|nr:hypothetical protein Pcinc_043303 [Petrolisthes cinctipes]